MITNVYIDGFNFYYACFKHDSYRHCKWLDLRTLSEAIVPGDSINRVHYFTAMVSSLPWNLEAPIRQETYIRALRTRPQLYVHLGKFQPVIRKGLLVGATDDPSATARITTWEEKGSDVNLATRLLLDAVAGDFEQTVVISNDSDLVEPVRAIKNEFGLHMKVVSPFPILTKKLRTASSSWAILDKTILPDCQLPDGLKDKKGRLITKPFAWTDGDGPAAEL